MSLNGDLPNVIDSDQWWVALVVYVVVQTISGAINKSIGLDSAQQKELIGTRRVKFSEGYKDRAVEVIQIKWDSSGVANK